LQSRIHELWARFLSSNLKDDLAYAPSDCFETFPFPANYASIPELEVAGRECYDFRAALMVRNRQGLTKTYNRFHDPEEQSGEVRQLRDLHHAMDLAVLGAYGWTDIQPLPQYETEFEEEQTEDDEFSGAEALEPKTKKKKSKHAATSQLDFADSE
jgi:hypothetical protein